MAEVRLATLPREGVDFRRLLTDPNPLQPEAAQNERHADQAKMDSEKAGPLAKALTGIQGLDEITSGGLPRGRPTLVCGGAGCGKTILAMEFLVRGATSIGEPGVFMSFEETAEDLTAERPLARVRPRRARRAETSSRSTTSTSSASEIEETGEYDLEGSVHPARPRDRRHRRQARRARHDRDAVLRDCPTRDPARRACGGCSAGSRTRASRPSSPASAATAA